MLKDMGKRQMDAAQSGPAASNVSADAARDPNLAKPTQKKPKSRVRQFAVGGLRAVLQLALIAGFIFGAFKTRDYLAQTAPKPPPRVAAKTVFPVVTTPVLFTSLTPKLELFGDTVAGRKVDLRALVAGEVIAVGDGLKDGGLVQAGDLLLRIDPFDYEGAKISSEAQLAEAEARKQEIEATLAQDRAALTRDREQLTLAQRDLQRAMQLVGRGTVSQKLVDDRRLVVTQRQAAVEQRQNGLKVTQARLTQQDAAIKRSQWSLRQAEKRLEQTELRAPFAAYVENVEAEVGRLLNVNDRVASLIDRAAIDVRFILSDAQYGRILTEAGTLIGRPVNVTWRVGDNGLSYPGRIERIGATIDASQGGVTVLARLDDPQSPQRIRPGAFVEVSVADRAFDKVVRLPGTAIYGSEQVFVVKDGALVPRAVSLVGRVGADVLVRGALSTGERILTTRLSAPGPGVLVQDRSTAQVSAVAKES